MNLKRFRKQITAAALAAALCASLCACANTPATQTGTTAAQETTAAQTVTPSSEHRKVIIDTDTGADDASALILAAKQKNVEILGVTVLVGNVDLERSTKNALAALELAGCDAPVYKGSADTLDGTIKNAFSVFGTDGMGDAGLVDPKKQAAEGESERGGADRARTRDQYRQGDPKGAGGDEKGEADLVDGNGRSRPRQRVSRCGIQRVCRRCRL